MNYLDKNYDSTTSYSVRLLGVNYQHFSVIFFNIKQARFFKFL